MSGGVPAGWVLVPAVATEAMEYAAVERVRPYHDLEDQWDMVIPGDLFRLAWPAMLSATPTPPSRDADVERELRTILQAVADADSEDCIGSIDVDIPKGGYPRQWLRDAARAALQALGERG